MGTFEETFQKHRAALIFKGKLKGIKNPSIPNPESLIGIERQKRLLTANTKLLVEGLPANDALLWGKRGTGKSSLVRSMLYIFEELKLLQLGLESAELLVDFFDFAHDSEGKFIVLIDDLSPQEEDERVLLLKSILDGSVVERPSNVVVYATSNRMNLLPSKGFKDYTRPNEEVEEITSLADRFGLKIGFTDFSKEAYLKAVEIYLKELGLNPDDGVKREALAFAAERGFSGRVAKQFASFYLAKRLQTLSV